jgi:hypothetical protein
MATTWQEAIEKDRKYNSDSTVSVVNAEFMSDLDHPQGGSIEQHADCEHYDVMNTTSEEKRENLTQDQVEAALTELGIANSDWH